ncbi:hypothetical protein ABZ820_35525 [Streptomyces diacarni]|uniref:hypothetical protein n=1 Tax=Streptomyces diacarni TaxID=2800381 RepID=UPI0033D27461
MSEFTDRLDPYELAHELAVADQLAAQQISADRDGARAMAARDQAAARRQGRPAPPRASTERRRSGAASRMVRAVRELRVMLRGADGEEHRPGPPEQAHAQQAAHQPDQRSAFETSPERWRPASAVRTDEAMSKRGLESEPNARRASLASTDALVAGRLGPPGFDQNAVSAAARISRAAGPKPNGNAPRSRPPKRHWEAAASQKQTQSRGMK